MIKEKAEALKGLFPEEIKRVEAGQCPLCGQAIDPANFRDQLSRREFEISGMCQVCQDNVFADEYGDPEVEAYQQDQADYHGGEDQ